MPPKKESGAQGVKGRRKELDERTKLAGGLAKFLARADDQASTPEEIPANLHKE